MPIRLRQLLRVTSALCLVVGLLLLGSLVYGIWQGAAQQQRLTAMEQQRLTQEWRQQPGFTNIQPFGPKKIDPSLEVPVDGIDFLISIPKIEYLSAVREGVDSAALYSSPGHYPGTTWPGEQGTVGIAAHNVYWIKFPQLARGDEVDLETRYGTFRYHITGSQIVNPDNRSALVADSPGYHLTLTTCWPLWAGAFATQRYIIFTDQFWPVPFAPRLRE